MLNATSARIAILILTASAGVGFSHAKTVGRYVVESHLYFKEYDAIPILLSNSEQPGDIYITPERGFIARKSVCFPSLDPSDSATNLVNSFDVKSYSVKGSVGFKVKKLAEILGSAGGDVSDEVSMKFSDANIKSLQQIELRSLDYPSSQVCKEAMNEIFGSKRPSSLQSVPWILQDVISAKLEITFSFKGGISDRVSASIKSDVARYIGDPEIRIAVDGDSIGMASLTTDELFPVAYRPAFISVADMERLKKLDDAGFFDWLGEIMGLNDTAADQLEEIRQKFPESLVRPSDLYRLMTFGSPVKFDIENEEHLLYIRRKNLILAASWEIYGEL